MIRLQFLIVFEAFVAVNILFFHGSNCHWDKAPYAFMKEATSAPAATHHDYIIIGGGTAGCPLAATLSQNATVLILERGGSPYGSPKITNIENFFTTLLDISPNSPIQPFVSEDGVLNHRGRVLGGSSAVNAGFYTRAGDEYVKGAGWDPTLADESYEWVEKVVAFEPLVKEWQSALRDGLLESGVLPYSGFRYEELYGTKIGGTIFDKEGRRHTAADLLQYADPTRIVVYLHATAQKILLRHNTGRSRPEAYGVIYKDAHGTMHEAYLINNSKSEIILSAGAIASPQLLMLSGIGPAHHLQAHGINVVLDQPMVGQGMADNPMTALIIPSPLPVEISLVEVVGYTRSGNYIEAVSGINVLPSWTQRLSEYYEHFLNQTDHPFTAPRDAMFKQADETMNTIFTDETIKAGLIVQKIDGPLSSGHLELKNTDPDKNLCVTFNYFKESEDLKRCVEGMKTLISVVDSKAFSKFRFREISVQDLINLVVKLPANLRPRHVSTTMLLEQFCIDTVLSLWHYHGGCQVGSVVDHEYKVLGVDALRVVDGSTFRGSPGANPQATVMMLGRYVGSKIMQDRST